MRTKVRAGDLSSRWARAMPAPTDSPWPSEPVAALTHGIRGVGWPSRSLVIFRRSRRLCERDDAGFGVDGPQEGRRVALGQDELVVGGVVRVLGVPAHLAEEEAGGEVGRGEAGRRMTRAGRRGHAQGMDAEPGRDLAEVVDSGHGIVLLDVVGDVPREGHDSTKEGTGKAGTRRRISGRRACRERRSVASSPGRPRPGAGGTSRCPAAPCM